MQPCLPGCGQKHKGVVLLLQVIFFVACLPWTVAPLTKPAAVSKEAEVAPHAAPLQVCYISACYCPADMLTHETWPGPMTAKQLSSCSKKEVFVCLLLP